MYRTSFNDNLKNRVLLTDIVFFIVLIIFITIGFRFIIYNQSQLPVFLFTKFYFTHFLTFPGGIAEYLAAFLRQFYLFSWAGVLINSLLVFSVAYLTKRIFTTLNVRSGNGILHFVPAIFLFVLLCNPQHNLAFSVSFILALVFFSFNISIAPRHTGLRILVYFIFALFVYFIGGGIFLLYCLLCVLSELLFCKGYGKFYISATLILAAVVVPYLSAKYLFTITVNNAYFYFLPFNAGTPIDLNVVVLLFFLPVVFLFFLLPKTFLISIKDWSVFTKLAKRFSKRNVGMARFVFTTVILISSLSLAFFLSTDKATNTRLKVQYYAANKMWEDVLKTVDKSPLVDQTVSFQTNRALFYTNQLGEKMFHYPQLFGFDGLFVDRNDDNRMIELCSDHYFDLGFINESMHWAYESFVFYGNKPQLLQRLALIYIINENYEAALKYLKPLSNTLFYKKWAKDYINKCNDPKLLEDDELVQEKRQFMPRFDFFADRNNPDIIMNFLLKQNSKNKMAFEYLMVYYMLSNKFLAFNNNLFRLNDFGYEKIPKHFQEVIAVIIDIRGEAAVKLEGYKFERDIINDFRSYVSTMQFNKGDLAKAMKPLNAKYGDTYWYFLDYISPVTRNIRMKGNNN